MKPREPVEWFAERMERRLRANDHKGGWEDCSIEYLLSRLCEETAELVGTITLGHADAREAFAIAKHHLMQAAQELDLTKRTSIGEAADVANFAMMIADKARASAGTK